MQGHSSSSSDAFHRQPLTPAVIDPTPYWRPAGFASAISVHDAGQWFAAEPGPRISATAHLEEFPQLFVRAAIYRVVTSIWFGTAASSIDDIVDLAVELAG